MEATQLKTTLNSVVTAFTNLNTQGQLAVLTGATGPMFGSESHLQGFARYGNYYLITQNRYEHDEGKLYFFDCGTLEYKGAVHLPANDADKDKDSHKYNHPGGIQVIDHYLLVPIQTQDYNQSKIQLWDLSPLDTGNINIVKVKDDLIAASDTLKIGGVGIVSYNNTFLVAACNNSQVYFYQSQGGDLANTSFNDLFAGTMAASASEVCLLADATGIYLIALYSEESSIIHQMTDFARLYQVDIANNRLTTEDAWNIHCYTNYSGVLSFAGVHFRYGAGIYIQDGNTLQLLVTERTIGKSGCQMNTFNQQ